MIRKFLCLAIRFNKIAVTHLGLGMMQYGKGWKDPAELTHPRKLRRNSRIHGFWTRANQTRVDPVTVYFNDEQTEMTRYCDRSRESFLTVIPLQQMLKLSHRHSTRHN